MPALNEFLATPSGQTLRFFGEFATPAALQAARPAASNAGSTATVLGVQYASNGTAWSPVPGAGIFGPYADATALQAAKPAASNPGAFAYVGASAPYAQYSSNGVAWSVYSGATLGSNSFTGDQDIAGNIRATGRAHEIGNGTGSTWLLRLSEPVGQTALTMDAYGAESVILARSALGVSSAPTALANNSMMLNVAARGYHNGGAFSTLSRVGMQFWSSEAWTPTANGTQITWYTTKNGEGAASSRMTLHDDGTLVLGLIGAPPLAKVANAGILQLNGSIGILDPDLPLVKAYRGGVVKLWFGVGNGGSVVSTAAAGDAMFRAEQKLVFRAGGDTGGFVVDASGNTQFTGNLRAINSITIEDSGLPLLKVSRAGVVKSYFGVSDGASIVSGAAAGDAILRAEGKLVVKAGGDTGGFTVDASGNTKFSGGFGCNGNTAQTKAAVNAACTDLATAVALVNQLRAALVANGICV